VKRGDVVIVVAPDEFGKPRPAVIVQANELGDRTTSLIVCSLCAHCRRRSLAPAVFDP